jgi:hypothetical protein
MQNIWGFWNFRRVDLVNIMDIPILYIRRLDSGNNNLWPPVSSVP